MPVQIEEDIEDTQMVEVVNPDRLTVIKAAEQYVTVQFPATSRARTFQARVTTYSDDRMPEDPPPCIPLALVKVDQFDTEGVQEENARLISPATLRIALTREQVEELGGLSAVFQAHMNDRLKLLRRDGPGDPWRKIWYMFNFDTTPGQVIITTRICRFSDFALVKDDGMSAQERAQADSTVTPEPTATPEPVLPKTRGVSIPGRMLLALTLAGVALLVLGSWTTLISRRRSDRSG